jgi:hypothetical protein
VAARHLTDRAWRALLSSPQPTDGLRIHQLAESFRDIERDRSDLGMLAGPRRRDEPGYRWLPYKEAFSPGLVRAVLDHWSGVSGMLLDQFAGGATSLLVAAERGLSSVGIELLPYAQWGADTIVRAHAADNAFFDRVVGEAVKAARCSTGRPLTLPVPAASWAVSDEVTGALLALREALPARGSGVEVDLAHLALLSVVESVSTAVKDGTSLRHRDRERNGRTTRPGRKGQQLSAAGVVDSFMAAADVISDDLAKLPCGTESRVLLGDARRLPLPDASVGSAVFSPPYPNRYDYSAIYQLELAAGGFVRVPEDLRRIRKSLLRSHLEAPPPDSSLLLDDPAVLAVLRAVAEAAEGGPGERGRTLRMLVGYFDDMCRVFSELARVLRPGAPAACVVATQTFFGCPVPTDVMLASIARRAGLLTEELWVLRHKRVAVQQRARGGVTSTGGRESALILRRP